MSDPRPPRFPYAAALLCAACLGAAAWTWMMYSYARNVQPGDIWTGQRPTGWVYQPSYPILGRRGTHEILGEFYPNIALAGKYVAITTLRGWLSETDEGIYVRFTLNQNLPEEQACMEVTFRGRVRLQHRPGDNPILRIDTKASRFTGASIAGLVVGAMGVFVFSVALRHWLNQRREFDAQ